MEKRRLSDSINLAVDGIIEAFRAERNLRIHFALTVVILLIALMLDLSKQELIMLFFAISLVIIVELENIALRRVIDTISLSQHPSLKASRDIAAGGVLIAVINAFIVGYIVLFKATEKEIIQDVLDKIRSGYSNWILIAFSLIIVLVIVGKVMGGKGTFLQGGLVSGHAAVAFAASTLILCLTKNMIATALAFFLAILVAQSRIEARFHKWFEVVIGALIGIATSLVIFYIFYSKA